MKERLMSWLLMSRVSDRGYRGLVQQKLLEPTSKMSFGPISLLVPRFKSSTTHRLPAV